MLRSCRGPETDEGGESFGYADSKVERLVCTFVRHGRLVSLPAQRGRRRTVLEHVVCSSSRGALLGARGGHGAARLVERLSGGHVALRRYLVDENLLDREGGEYWRRGGWLDQ